MLLGAFFDDSGTHDKSPVVTLGAVLGTDVQWDAFADAWKTRLSSPLPGKPPLRAFHLSACRGAWDEFRDYSEADRNRITYLFRKIILDMSLVTVAAAVDKVAWGELVTDELMDGKADPLEFCFVKTVDTIIHIVRARKPWEKILLFFDKGTQQKLEQWARFYRMQSDKYPEIAGVTFAPVKQVEALQAADMIATETFYYGQEWLRDGPNATPNPHFRDFVTRDLSAGVIVGRDEIGEMVERIRRGPPNA